MMKGVHVVLIILVAAYFFSATASGGESAMSLPGYENSGALSTGADTKRVEVRMNEALSLLEAHRRAAIDKKEASGIINAKLSGSPNNSNELLATQLNSSGSNINSTNSSMNSSALNSSAASPNARNGNSLASSSDGKTSPEGALNESGYVNPEGIATNSRANFKGYYGITASQHEMGKGGIDSRTFLSGTFAMDKTVKFQDRGI
jgi:hypothetical protein